MFHLLSHSFSMRMKFPWKTSYSIGLAVGLKYC